MNFAFLQAIPVPALVISSQDTLSAANSAFANLFPQMRIGRSYLTVLRQAGLVELIEAQRNGIQSGSVEFTVQGQVKASFLAAAATLDDDHVLLCLQDVNETAVAVEMRQNFVADLSHELKSPLTAISGILETCHGDKDALAHFLPMILDEVDRMTRLVADLLTLSRVEANERRTPGQKVVLQALVEAACAPLRNLARQSDTRIETDLPDVPIQFQGDPDEIVRAIRNLVENAVQYSGFGGLVTVSGAVNHQDEAGGAPHVSIQISDDGPGVEDHHIPRLTERFYRIDDHRSRDSGGSGLGLAIVKHIVNHHRGRMTFEARVGEGSQVTVTLPLEQGNL